MHLQSRANYSYAHLRGEPLLTHEDNPYVLKLSHTFIPVENFNQFLINHQKGGVVSASSATPTWFWSIDDKLVEVFNRDKGM